MELVKTNPELSPFQHVLLRGIREGVLLEGDLVRIKREGSALTLVTAERFFKASAREESYRYAVRLIDCLLSYQLKNSEDGVGKLRATSLSDIVREAVAKIRSLSVLADTDSLPRAKALTDLLSTPVEKASKLSCGVGEMVRLIETDISYRKKQEQTLTLAEFFIGRVGGKADDFDSEFGSSVCYAELVSIIYGLSIGPYMTKKELTKVARRNRPTIKEVKFRLQEHKKLLPEELRQAYQEVCEDFLMMSATIDFFDRKAPLSVLTAPDASMYYAEKGALAFD